MRLKFEGEILTGPVARDKIVFNVFLTPAIHEPGGVGFQRVDAGEGFRRGVIPGEERLQAFRAKLLPPFFHEPFGMGPAERRLGNFHVGENFFNLVGFAQVAAQYGVDETGLSVVAGAFGLLDGFMDSGVRRDTVEPEKLVEAEAQEILKRRALFPAGRGPAGDEAVERGLPADDATDEFVAQAAIGGRKARGGESGFQQIFREFAAGQPLRQNSRRNLSWILCVQQL